MGGVVCKCVSGPRLMRRSGRGAWCNNSLLTDAMQVQRVDFYATSSFKCLFAIRLQVTTDQNTFPYSAANINILIPLPSIRLSHDHNPDLPKTTRTKSTPLTSFKALWKARESPLRLDEFWICVAPSRAKLGNSADYARGGRKSKGCYCLGDMRGRDRDSFHFDGDLGK